MSLTPSLRNRVVLAFLVLSGLAHAAKTAKTTTAAPRAKIARASGPTGDARQSAVFAATPTHTTKPARAQVVRSSAQQARPRDDEALKRLMDFPWEQGHVPLLKALHQLHVETGTSSRLALHTAGKVTLIISKTDPELHITRRGQTRRATLTDLQALEISTVDQLQALLRKRLRALFAAAGKTLPDDDAAITNAVHAKITEAKKYAELLADRPDLMLLRSHDLFVSHWLTPHTDRLELLGGNGDDALLIDGKRQLSLLEGDTLRLVTEGDLTRLGLGTVAEFDALLARHLVRRAALGGDANDPSIVENARRLLQQQVRDVMQLWGWLDHPMKNGRFAQIIARMKEAGRKSLVVASGGNTALAIEEQADGSHRFALVSANQERAQATVADLLDLHIADKPAFEAALDEAHRTVMGTKDP